eukprot:GHRR01014324.1.p1 GENE.GHRR01014324.1~~GHRR01014324.1.p1  ORF type:complete len:474 (+),score=152.92 GHRR01014324.1:89-1510(+)
MGNLSSSNNSASQYSGGSARQQQGNQFRAIADRFSSLEQVQEALRREGLESSNLVVAVDFTKSNEWTGKHSFGGRSLHHLGDTPNPYEEAMTIIGKTLATFDDDALIPAYGFGDAACQDACVFSFNPGDAPCHGLESVVGRYRQLISAVRLAGPTSFAPAIWRACQVVADSGGRFHILLIIADGQVTRSSDLAPGCLSPQESATIDALVAASRLPLAVVMVGVGDGPWNMMKHFDDNLPQRCFDNFQFVNFTEIMASYPCSNPARREAAFGLAALMELPEQYKAIQRLGLLGQRGSMPSIPAPLQPPMTQPGLGSYRSFGAAGSAEAAADQPSQVSAYPAMSAIQPTAAALAVNGNGAGFVNPNPGWGMPQAGTEQLQQQYAPGNSSGANQQPQQQQQQPDPLATPMFLCPITQDVMQDPVIAADGYTYERSAIQVGRLSRAVDSNGILGTLSCAVSASELWFEPVGFGIPSV